MKKPIKIFSLLLVLVGSVPLAAFAGEPGSEKTKSYSKSYQLGSSDKVVLENSFGEMKIATWSKNEVKVDVAIIAKAGTDENAQKILDAISIEDGKNGREVFFKTHIGNENNNRDRDRSEKGESSSMKINYTVYLPANAALDATNQFGPLSIGDYDGALYLTSKFGSITAGKLSQPKKIDIEFGSITSVIESVNNGKLSIQFSRAQINKLSGDVSASFNQSHGIKLVLDNSLKKLDINNNFGEVLLDADKNLSASFNIQSSFGKFSNESSFAVNKNKDDEDSYVVTNQTYTGKSGSGTSPITIKNSFGKIVLGHGISFDVNEKWKDKDKSEKKKTRA